MVNADVTEPLILTVAGFKLAVAPVGSPVMLMVPGPVKPFNPDMVIVPEALEAARMHCGFGGVMVKS